MIKFYKNRVALNCLAIDKENAKEIFDAIDGHILIGILSKNFDNVKVATEYIDDFASHINNAISIGLGAGDPKQSDMVSEIAQNLKINPQHINQVFTGVSGSRFMAKDSFINALISPSGIPGKVKISTGPSSSQGNAIVDINDAIAMIKDMGGKSIKYYPMKGLATIKEFIKVAQACGQHSFGLEPTGGISLDNLEEILNICKKYNVTTVIPHLYTSIINKETGKTKVEDVKKVFAIFKKVYG